MGIQIIWSHVVFEETAVGICDALFMSGFHADLVYRDFEWSGFRKDVLYVILGLHRKRVNCSELPDKYIAVQAEQIGSKWMTKLYLQNLREALCVWDFSPRNCSFFRSLGITCYNVGTRVPMEIFYPGSLSRKQHFSRVREKDIDVLFYSARCPRRQDLERNLSKTTSLKVVFRYNDLFREEREDLISRSKIVLNVHYWPSASLETHRVEYLCSRGKCVLSERSSDPELDLEYSNCVAFFPLSKMVEAVELYAISDKLRE
ncbi:unnamed protein product, partial [Sphacelaria rigidula]